MKIVSPGSTRKAVRKIYATENKAAQYSPVGQAIEVFILDKP